MDLGLARGEAENLSDDICEWPQMQRRRVVFQRGNDIVSAPFFIRDFVQQSLDGSYLVP